MKNLKYVLFLLLLTTACKENKEEVATSQMEEVIDIHDEVMPKMSTIGKLVEELKPRIDSTEGGREYAAAVEDLQDAHKAMMDWMKGFGDRFDFDEIKNGKELSEEKQEWLDEEETKVKAMRDQVNKSIARAQKLRDGE